MANFLQTVFPNIIILTNKRTALIDFIQPSYAVRNANSHYYLFNVKFAKYSFKYTCLAFNPDCGQRLPITGSTTQWKLWKKEIIARGVYHYADYKIKESLFSMFIQYAKYWCVKHILVTVSSCSGVKIKCTTQIKWNQKEEEEEKKPHQQRNKRNKLLLRTKNIGCTVYTVHK